MCVALLVERGALGYDDRIAAFWPEFATAGKDEVTLAQALSHQAGLPGFAEPTSVDDLLDQELCAARLAAQAPLWKPGSANGYHAATWGVLVAEIVRRIDGRSIGRFLCEELAGPLGADFHIGLPARIAAQIAELIPPDNPADMGAIEMNPAMQLALASPALDPARANSPDWRAAEIPAMNGHGSAQGIAKLYSALLAREAPVAFLSQGTFEAMTRRVVDRPDLVLGFNPQWSMGFARNAGGMLGPEPETFGHGGWGGSLGCAHATAGIAIGYAPNHMGAELVGDPRATAICRTVFDCVR
jgi:CubicO group peptidase (beta-lactamase class C family)